MDRGTKASYAVSSLFLYFELVRVHLLTQLRYVGDFWLLMGMMGIEQLLGLFTIGIIFSKIKAMAGWSLNEMVFLYALSILSTCIYRAIMQGVTDISRLIEKGEFDQILTRPRPSLLLLVTRWSNVRGLVDGSMGIIILLIAASKMQYAWSITRVASVLVFIISANIIIATLTLMQASISFWLVRFTALHQILMYIREFGRYPIKIYPLFIQVVLTGIIPIAYTTYYPACSLLGKGIHTYWILAAVPLVTLAVASLAVGFYNLGIRHYKSTGS